MKLLHVANLRGFGGIQRLVAELAIQQVHTESMQVAVLSLLNDSQDMEKELHQYVKVYSINIKSGYDILPSTFIRLFKVFKEYDLLHFHEFNIPAALCAILSRKKIVFTEHGTFQRANIKPNLNHFIRKRVLESLFLKYFVNVVVANSHWIKENLPIRISHCAVIHNGTKAKRSISGIRNSNDIFKILFIGRFAERKRIERLIKGYSKVKDRQGMLLQIVGDGALRSKLESEAASLLEENSYKFYGYQQDVARFYDEAGIFVLPSDYEPFGLVVVEAILCEIPVICFRDGGGALEIVNGTHDNLIVKNEDELAVAIQYWKDNPDEKSKVGKLLKKRAETNFSIERMSSEYEKLYEKILTLPF